MRRGERNEGQGGANNGDWMSKRMDEISMITEQMRSIRIENNSNQMLEMTGVMVPTRKRKKVDLNEEASKRRERTMEIQGFLISKRTDFDSGKWVKFQAGRSQATGRKLQVGKLKIPGLTCDFWQCHEKLECLLSFPSVLRV